MKKNKKGMSKKYYTLFLHALDLQSSIKNAAWDRGLTHPTTHMQMASDNLCSWMDEAGIPRITYSEENGL